jgi:dihydrofolate synthase/folylpolyglutamate synthase
VDGKARPIGEAELVDVLARTERANAGDAITFFEITTAAALQAFAEHPADAVILEVGLGGRLDATNVVARPALSIITPVSLDHQDKLGGTLGAVAGEKAGILKAGVPAVVSRQLPEALGVIRARAETLGAPLVVWGEDYEAFEQRGRLVYQSAQRLMDLALPALMGQHQVGNAGTAIAAALRLAPLGVADPDIERGLLEVRWPARMQRLDNGPLSRLLAPGSELWLDGAHNPAGAQAIAQTLAELEERAPKPVGLVIGIMGQKDAAAILAPFRGLVRRVVTVPIPGAHEATHDPVALARIAASAGLAADAAPDVEAAIARLQKVEPGPLRILICGSLYLAGHVLALQDGVQAQMN